MQKITIICGPTATGKSELGISLATKHHTDIISADSRQMYSGMDIGTGKDIPIDSTFKTVSKIISDEETYDIGYYEINNIKHWLFDMANPKQRVNSGLFRNACLKVLELNRDDKKLPIIVGGTGFYIRSFINPPETISIPPNFKLRQKLAQLDLPTLQIECQKNDLQKWQSLNQSDQKNPRRLIRAIEVAQSTSQPEISKNIFDPIWIGLTGPLPFLFERIQSRILSRINAGFIEEVSGLMKVIPDFNELPSGKTMGYVHVGKYLAGELSKDQALSDWLKAEEQYAKRQMTWFNKQPGIVWFDITQKNWYANVIKQLDMRMSNESNDSQN